ncbi:MAG: tetratricopeptide repeat protein [Proteobacteria bacterium]|nr:tetratricopeptide repeat protein [Pseudomonadota bacterium]
MLTRSARGALSALALLLAGTSLATASPGAGVPVRSGGAPPPAAVAAHPAYGAFLAARFAAAEGDVGYAATAYLKVLASDPANQELAQQAFIVSVLAGRPEASRLAAQLSGNPIAQLLLVDNEMKAGNWDAAERRARALPSQGLTQIVQPLLIAWAQSGAGRTDAALATLRPLVEGTRFRGVYALHAGMIADVGGRTAEAGRLYKIAQTNFDGVNLRLAQIVASWQARQGHLADAQRILQQATSGGDAMALAQPALVASSLTRPVNRPTDGVAEAYLALAGALRQQDATDLSLLLLHLALELRPDFTPARMLTADIMEGTHHPDGALAMLAPVSDQDPLASVVRLNRAQLLNATGHSDEAVRQLERLAHDYPASPAPDVALGDILREKFRYQDAIAAYTRALARKKPGADGVWPLLYARGVAYERSHQWPLAEADFRKALELSPNQPIVLNYLGYSWADQGVNLPEARKMIEAALRQRPDDGAIIDSLGWVTLRQGDPQAAVKLLERAVELQPVDPTINGHLGDAYWAVGRKLEATYQWRRALTLHPEPEDAARVEARLRDSGALADQPMADNHSSTIQ